MDMDLFNSAEDQPQQQETPQHLTCVCPKCSVSISLDFEQVEIDHSVRNCPQCRTKYVLTREPFSCRASRHTGEINCSHCGSPLDHHQYCPSCNILYPDYFVAEFPDAAKKRERKNKDYFGWLKNISFELPSRSVATNEYKPVHIETDAWKEHEPSTINKKYIRLGVISAVIIAAISTSFVVYNNIQTKNKYVSTYIMALYGIKVGSDMGIKLGRQLTADWVVRESSGQASPSRISVDDENALNKIKSKTEAYMQKLSEPPRSYAEAHSKIQNLNALYNKLNAAVQNPSGSATTYKDIILKTETEIQTSFSELKKNLPQDLSKELEVAKLKYSSMGNI